MKKWTTLFVAMVFLGAIWAMPALAKDEPVTQPKSPQKPSPMVSEDKQEFKTMLKDASTMMGYVGIANIALLHNMTDEAADTVQKALTIARKLEGQTAQFNAKSLKLGKLKYKSPTGESHNYWLPIENDTFVVDALNSEYLMSKEPKAAEVDAQLVNTTVTLNTKQVRDYLEKASSAISIRNYGDAQLALLNAQMSTFTEDTISELPLATTLDNLTLARELVKSKDYAAASFALKHAKDALKEYQKSAGKDNALQADKLQTEISALQAEIAKDKMSVVATIEKRIGSWIDRVKSLFTKSK